MFANIKKGIKTHFGNSQSRLIKQRPMENNGPCSKKQQNFSGKIYLYKMRMF